MQRYKLYQLGTLQKLTYSTATVVLDIPKNCLKPAIANCNQNQQESIRTDWSQLE